MSRLFIQLKFQSTKKTKIKIGTILCSKYCQNGIDGIKTVVSPTGWKMVYQTLCNDSIQRNPFTHKAFILFISNDNNKEKKFYVTSQLLQIWKLAFI